MVEIIYALAGDRRFNVIKEEEGRYFSVSKRQSGRLEPVVTVDVHGRKADFHGPYLDSGRDMKEIEPLIAGLEKEGYSHDLDTPKPERSCRGDGSLCD